MTINFLIIMLLIFQIGMPLNYFNFKKNELIINTVISSTLFSTENRGKRNETGFFSAQDSYNAPHDSALAPQNPHLHVQNPNSSWMLSPSRTH